MKQNIIPVTLVYEKDKVRIVDALFKVILLALVVQLAALLKKNFAYAFFFSGNFHSNCSSEFLLVAGPERLYNKAIFLSNTRKVSQGQKKTIPCALQSRFF